ncbi:hypothetical protein EG328_000487 [Venturia inaequalis]|uniref:Uncharacterized protein n=1 Tax=Venturia inaequalis TaxID=5025 RepID=A0A8H3V306_VENIN|nr:hypothetical protein EG328_000487 [Venturia inaequalis]
MGTANRRKKETETLRTHRSRDYQTQDEQHRLHLQRRNAKFRMARRQGIPQKLETVPQYESESPSECPRDITFLHLPRHIRLTILTEAWTIPRIDGQVFGRACENRGQFNIWQNDIQIWAAKVKQVHLYLAGDVEAVVERCMEKMLRRWLVWAEAKLLRTPRFRRWNDIMAEPVKSTGPQKEAVDFPHPPTRASPKDSAPCFYSQPHDQYRQYWDYFEYS